MNMPALEVFQESSIFANLNENISKIYDPRQQKKVTYKLEDLIILALSGLIAGANNWVDIACFGKQRKRWLKEYLAIEKIPSHDTLNRVFSLIDPLELNTQLISWLNKTFLIEAKIINIDGKFIEGYSAKDPLILLRAWCQKNKVVLQQFRVPKGTNEITVVPTLIKALNVENKIFTMDALNSQKENAKIIIETNNHYVMALKGNQHQFFNDIKLFLDSITNNEFNNVPYQYYETKDKNHGRTEIRRCWTSSYLSEWLEQLSEWEGLASITVVETEIHSRKKTTINRRYFISSLDANAQKILSIIRSHWSIENQLHWHLDVSMDEDKSTIKDFLGAQNASFLRAFAISLLSKILPKTGFKQKRQIVNRRPSLFKKIFIN